MVEGVGNKSPEQIVKLNRIVDLFKKKDDEGMFALSEFYRAYDRVTMHEASLTNIFSHFNEFVFDTSLAADNNNTHTKTNVIATTTTPISRKLNYFYCYFYNNSSDENFKKFVNNLKEFILRIQEISYSNNPNYENPNNSFLADIKY